MEAAQAPDHGEGKVAPERLRLVLSDEAAAHTPPDVLGDDQLLDAALHEAALDEEALRVRGIQYGEHGKLAEDAGDLMIPPEQYTYRDPATNRKFSIVAGPAGGAEAIKFEDPQVEKQDERSRTVRYQRYVREEVTLDPSRMDQDPHARPRKYSIWKRRDLLAEIHNETHEVLHRWDDSATEADADEVRDLRRMLTAVVEGFNRPRAN